MKCLFVVVAAIFFSSFRNHLLPFLYQFHSRSIDCNDNSNAIDSKTRFLTWNVHIEEKEKEMASDIDDGGFGVIGRMCVSSFLSHYVGMLRKKRQTHIFVTMLSMYKRGSVCVFFYRSLLQFLCFAKAHTIFDFNRKCNCKIYVCD